MSNAIAVESENGMTVSVLPNADKSLPHVALTLSHPNWGADERPMVGIARLSPSDARALSLSLAQCADRVQVRFNEYEAEVVEGGGGFDYGE